ncbi:MAG: magnesium transporter [Cryomorphaceae bacterium]|nr:MAG: magnesium transporter [Cryomorphaceae bacterium]
MQFELTKAFIEEIQNHLDNGNKVAVAALIADLHPADVAEIMQQFRDEHARDFFELVAREKRADVFLELDEDWREAVLSSLSSEEIARQIIDEIDSDDAADLISELPEKQQQEVMSLLEDDEQADDIRQLMRYPEDSAGGIMAKELVMVHEDWTIAQGIREMRKQAEEVNEVYTIYVVNEQEKLIGTLSLKQMVFNPSSVRATFKDVATKEAPIFIRAQESAEEAAKIMEKYDLVALPVVDEAGRLLGRITIDDVVDIMKEEAERDYQMASGLSDKVDVSDTILEVTRARLPWLVIGLMGGLLVANVISVYEAEIAKITQLALFMPLIAAMGGNVGVQSSAIVVQGLANSSIDMQKLLPRLLKELVVAIVSGAICASIVLTYNIVFEDSMRLGFTVGLALFSVIIFAALFGTFVPLMLNRFKIDPAVATGPFITTSNDIIGLAIYFMIARQFFNLA